MPRVPTYDSFQATPNTLPQSFAKAPDVLVDPGQTGKVMGEALTHAGDAAGNVAMDLAAKANQSRLDDATLQLRRKARYYQYDKTAGYANLKGRDALERPEGIPLPEEVGGRLQQDVDAISQSLGNDAQKQAFAHFAGGFVDGFKDNVWQHVVREQRTFDISTAEGLRDEAIEEAKTNYRNPQAWSAAVASIRQQNDRLGELHGLDVPAIDMQSKKDISTAIKSGVDAYQADGDALGAAKFYDDHKHLMTMDDGLVVSKQVKSGVNTYVGLNAGQEAFNHAKPPAPAQIAYDALVTEVFSKGVVMTESGGKPGVVTHLNKNGTTDYGPGQLNEKTGPEAARLAGVKWDLERLKTEPAYGYALSLAVFQDRYAQNGNDFSKTIGEYHAPKRTQDAIKEAKKSGGYWLDYADDELKSYVNKTMDNYNRAALKPPKEMTMGDVEAQLAKKNLNPDQLAKARAEGEYQIKNYNAQIKTQEETSVNTALDEARRNQVPFEKLPFAVQNAVPAYKVGEVKDKIKKILDTGDVSTDWKVYAGLRDMATTDPGNFKTRDLSLNFSTLAEPQRKELIDLQAKMKDPSQAVHAVELGKQLEIAHNTLGIAASVFTSKKGKFDSAVMQAIASESAHKGGRELDYSERQKIIDRMMLPATRSSNIWFGNSTKKMYEVYGSPDEADYKPDIPDSERKLITKALVAEGAEPSEANITARFKMRFGL